MLPLQESQNWACFFFDPPKKKFEKLLCSDSEQEWEIREDWAVEFKGILSNLFKSFENDKRNKHAVFLHTHLENGHKADSHRQSQEATDGGHERPQRVSLGPNQPEVNIELNLACKKCH